MTDLNYEDAGQALDELTLATTNLNVVLMAAGREPITLPLRATPIGPFFRDITKLVRDLAVEAAR
jgi:hypothetical protein